MWTQWAVNAHAALLSHQQLAPRQEQTGRVPMPRLRHQIAMTLHPQRRTPGEEPVPEQVRLRSFIRHDDPLKVESEHANLSDHA